MLQKIVTLLYLGGEPLPLEKLTALLAVSADEIAAIIPELSKKLEEIGLSLLVSNDGYSIVTRPEQSALVEAFRKEELEGELTPAALQVLTLVAYLGNPTREQISYTRGVQSSQSIRTLTVRGLIERKGEVCTLTTDSLKHLGITKAEELPEYESIRGQLLEKLAVRES
jgi:segregation and condensation protein B